MGEYRYHATQVLADFLDHEGMFYDVVEYQNENGLVIECIQMAFSAEGEKSGEKYPVTYELMLRDDENDLHIEAKDVFAMPKNVHLTNLRWVNDLNKKYSHLCAVLDTEEEHVGFRFDVPKCCSDAHLGDIALGMMAMSLQQISDAAMGYEFQMKLSRAFAKKEVNEMVSKLDALLASIQENEEDAEEDAEEDSEE